MNERFICIHGHFYQPPRENPWLDAVERQESAFPHHDWNERITAECYAPNTAARILDGRNRIVDIVNNFARISFNVGPTLARWLDEKHPSVSRAIRAADEESRRRFSGHGSAIAQAYHHTILPLADRRDRRTEILWGLADFEKRFGRKAEGMWLPETASDLDTLEELARSGLAFTILAPHQAVRFRRIGVAPWTDVSGSRIDPRRAYRVSLPSGRSLALFFYDGAISRAVAFEELLREGEDFAGRLLGAFSDDSRDAQLVHLATDGETYGHHHRFGDMALAAALAKIDSGGGARLTNYGEFLERHPPEHEVEVVAATSWSCAHGIERWRADCGCSTGARPGWNQAWRPPLRESLDWLGGEIAPRFEARGREFFADPWSVRDEAEAFASAERFEQRQAFVAAHAARRLTGAETVSAMMLLELAHNALRMFTSCGWFFDDVSGIESGQILQYAARALELSRRLFGVDLEAPFLQRLSKARSNDPSEGDGRAIFERTVRGASVTLERAAAHYAFESLLEDPEARSRLYSLAIDREEFQKLESGSARLAIGIVRVASTLTGESAREGFCAIHLGGHNIVGGARELEPDAKAVPSAEPIVGAFHAGNLAEAIRLIDRDYARDLYSLQSLFSDERNRLLGSILAASLQEIDASVSALYARHGAPMRFLTKQGIAAPHDFRLVAEATLTARLRAALEEPIPSTESIAQLFEEARQHGVPILGGGLAGQFQNAITRAAGRLLEAPLELPLVNALYELAEVASLLSFEIDLWSAQNAWFQIRRDHGAEVKSRAASGDEESGKWMEAFRRLGEKLGFAT